MYEEYIFMNAACDKIVRPTSIATFADRLPSESELELLGANNGLEARSRAGRKLSLWKINSDSRPPKTIFRSLAGMTVSLFEEPSTLTGALDGWI